MQRMEAGGNTENGAGSVVREYLTYSESETYTGLSRVTLWRAVRSGKLRACGYGTATRFRTRDLDALMENKPRRAPLGGEDG